MAAMRAGEADCALVRADVVPGLQVIRLAAARAVYMRTKGHSRARTLLDELMVSICPVRSASEGVRRFGVPDGSSGPVIAVRVTGPAAEGSVPVAAGSWAGSCAELAGAGRVVGAAAAIDEELAAVAATDAGKAAVMRAFKLTGADLTGCSMVDACCGVVGGE